MERGDKNYSTVIGYRLFSEMVQHIAVDYDNGFSLPLQYSLTKCFIDKFYADSSELPRMTPQSFRAEQILAGATH